MNPRNRRVHGEAADRQRAAIRLQRTQGEWEDLREDVARHVGGQTAARASTRWWPPAAARHSIRATATL